jgi:hypothetical protein
VLCTSSAELAGLADPVAFGWRVAAQLTNSELLSPEKRVRRLSVLSVALPMSAHVLVAVLVVTVSLSC